ncbi:hypothetical protein ACSBR2_032019 [Camellia fascicularis]
MIILDINILIVLDINILLEYGCKNETPVLIAAKNGIVEIVEEIVGHFPEAIHDINSDGKGMVLLAVENRQTVVFQYLLKRYVLRDTNYHEVDKYGNNALHLAAKISDRPWLIPGLKMQWEIKWYENQNDFKVNRMWNEIFSNYGGSAAVEDIRSGG